MLASESHQLQLLNLWTRSALHHSWPDLTTQAQAEFGQTCVVFSTRQRFWNMHESHYGIWTVRQTKAW